MKTLYLNYIYIISFSFIAFSFLIFFRKYFLRFDSNYNAYQRIHKNYVPPYGGLIIFICYFFFLRLLNKDSPILDLMIFLPSCLIILVGTIEDTYNNIKPVIRFFVIFFSSFIFVFFFQEKLPTIDIPFVNQFFLQNSFYEIFFYSFGLTALANGSNMIDGMNGLASLSALSNIAGLSFVLFIVGEFNFYKEELLFLALLLLVFIFFNFPFGKIFLGDAGAYWLGWIIGVLVIHSYSSNLLNTWGAVLIIFYPIMEVSFSTIRKLFQKQNPLKPDFNHLHSRVYFYFKKLNGTEKKINNYTTLALFPLWLFPNLLIFFTLSNPYKIWGSLAMMSLVYFSYYFFTPYQKNTH